MLAAHKIIGFIPTKDSSQATCHPPRDIFRKRLRAAEARLDRSRRR
jgi:hypothetical protein